MLTRVNEEDWIPAPTIIVGARTTFFFLACRAKERHVCSGFRHFST